MVYFITNIVNFDTVMVKFLIRMVYFIRNIVGNTCTNFVINIDKSYISPVTESYTVERLSFINNCINTWSHENCLLEHCDCFVHCHLSSDRLLCCLLMSALLSFLIVVCALDCNIIFSFDYSLFYSIIPLAQTQ